MRRFIVISGILIALYVCGYYITVQRFIAYCGSAPYFEEKALKGQSWETSFQAGALYIIPPDTNFTRLAASYFWKPIHWVDLQLRPSYWTIILRYDEHGAGFLESSTRLPVST